MMHKRHLLTITLAWGLALAGCGKNLDTSLEPSASASFSPASDAIRPDSKGDKNNAVEDVNQPIRPDSKGDKNNAVEDVNQPIRPDSKGDKNNLASIQATLRLPFDVAPQLAVMPPSLLNVGVEAIFGAPAYANGYFTEVELQTFLAQVDGDNVPLQVLSVVVDRETGDQLVTYAMTQVVPNINQHVAISSPSGTLVLGTLISATQANQTLHLSEEVNLDTTAWAMVAQVFQKKQGNGLKDTTFAFLGSLRTGPEIAAVAKRLKAEFSNPRNQGKKLNELTELTALVDAETEKLIKAKNPQAQQNVPPTQANNGQNNDQSSGSDGQGSENGQGLGSNNGQGNGSNNCNGKGNGNHSCSD